MLKQKQAKSAWQCLVKPFYASPRCLLVFSVNRDILLMQLSNATLTRSKSKLTAGYRTLYVPPFSALLIVFVVFFLCWPVWTAFHQLESSSFTGPSIFKRWHRKSNKDCIKMFTAAIIWNKTSLCCSWTLYGERKGESDSKVNILLCFKGAKTTRLEQQSN